MNSPFDLDETILAQAIYRALKQAPGAMVQGSPAETEKTIIDGTFKLRLVARAVLADLAEGEGDAPAREASGTSHKDA